MSKRKRQNNDGKENGICEEALKNPLYFEIDVDSENGGLKITKLSENLSQIGEVKLAHYGAIRCLSFNNNGNEILSGNSIGVMKLWDVHSGRLLRSFVDPSLEKCEAPAKVGFLLDYKFSYYKGMFVNVAHVGDIQSAAFDPKHGNQILSVCSYDGVKAWNESGLQYTRDVKGVTILAFFPDSKAFVVGTESGEVLKFNNSVKKTKDPGHSWKEIDSNGDKITCLKVNGSGSRVVFGTEQGCVFLTDSALKLLHKFHNYEYSVMDIAFGKHGNNLLAVDEEMSFEIWNMHTGKTVHSFRDEDWRPVDSVSFNADGTKVIAHHIDDCEVGRYNIDNTTIEKNDVFFSSFGDSDNCVVALFKDFNRIVCGGGEKAVVFDLDGKETPLHDSNIHIGKKAEAIQFMEACLNNESYQEMPRDRVFKKMQTDIDSILIEESDSTELTKRVNECILRYQARYGYTNVETSVLSSVGKANEMKKKQLSGDSNIASMIGCVSF
jgi:WD40 repeat protein